MILFIVILGCNSRWDGAHLDKVTFSNIKPGIETLIDSSHDSDSVTTNIGHIGEMHIGSDSMIYISDLISQKIKKFDSFGQHKNDIGKRGRSRGEFMGIKSFIILKNSKGNDTLVITDDVNNRISLISSSGRLLSSIENQQPNYFLRGKLRRLISNHNYYYLFLTITPKESTDSNCLFHFYNNQIDQKLGCYGHINDLQYVDNHDFIYLSRARSGNIVIDGKNSIYYTPFLFDGLIYKYSFDSKLEKWVLNKYLKGFVHSTKPILEYGEPSNYRYSNKGEISYGKILNSSRGLFIENDKLIHFTSITDLENNTHFGMEIYKDDELIAYKEITNIELNSSNHAINVLSSGSEYTYYFSDTRHPNKLFRMSIK